MENEKITLSDLKSEGTEKSMDSIINELDTNPVHYERKESNMVEVDISDIAPNAIKKPETKDDLIEKTYGSKLQDVVDRVAKSKIDAISENAKLKEDDIPLDQLEEQNEIVNVSEKEEDIKDELNVVKDTSKSTYEDDEDELENTSELIFDEDDDEDNEAAKNEEQIKLEQKQFEEMKHKLKEKIKPVTIKYDLSSFTISNSAISVNNAMESVEDEQFDWMLYNTNKVLSMREFKGLDIEKLMIRKGSNLYLEYMRRYKILFDHVTNPNKPASTEQWLKSISYSDEDHIFFLVYCACFSGSNFIPYRCTNEECNHVFISDNIPTEDMISYESEKAKAQVKSLLEKGEILSDEYETEIVPISENYAVSIKEPSIFNVTIENSVLDAKYLEKYADILALIQSIDSIYKIDYNSRQLRPIEFPTQPNKIAANYKAKIKICEKVIKTLNSDQLLALNDLKNKVSEINDPVSYCIPEMKCPKCGHIIKKEILRAEQMLFTRHQLVALANS